MFFQVLVDLSLSDHIWVDKRAVIAKKVEDLGDKFCPALRTGWLAYIMKEYSANAAQHGSGVGQGESIEEDSDE
jgi:hypothetical protein